MIENCCLFVSDRRNDLFNKNVFNVSFPMITHPIFRWNIFI